MVNVSAVNGSSAKRVVKGLVTENKPSIMERIRKYAPNFSELNNENKSLKLVGAATAIAATSILATSCERTPWDPSSFDFDINQTVNPVTQTVNVDFSALAGLLTQLLEQQNNLSQQQYQLLLQILQSLNDLNNTTGNINTQLTGMNQQLAQIIAALSLIMANQNTIIGNQDQQTNNQTTMLMLLQMMSGDLSDKLNEIRDALLLLHSDNQAIAAQINQMSSAIQNLLQQGNALLSQGNATAQAQYDAFNQMATQLVVAFATITSQLDDITGNQQTSMQDANARFNTLMNMINTISSLLADSNSLLTDGNALGAQGLAGINAIYDLVSVFSANVASFDESVLQKLQLIINKLSQSHGYLANIAGNTAASAQGTAYIANVVSAILPYVQHIDANTQNIDYNNATTNQLLTALFANLADRLDNMDGHLVDINNTLVTIDGHQIDFEAVLLAAMQSMANDINTNNNNNNAALIATEAAFFNQILGNQETMIGQQGSIIDLLNQNNAIAIATKQFLAGGLNMIKNAINANTGAVNQNTAATVSAINSFKMMFYGMAQNIMSKIDNFANMNASQQNQIIALLEDYMPLLQDIYDGIAQGNATSELIYNETQAINGSINVLGIPLHQLVANSFFMSGQLGLINGHLGDISGQLNDTNSTLSQILEQEVGININTSTMAQHLGQINNTTNLIYNQQLSQAEWNEVAKAEILEAMGAMIQLQAAGNQISGVTNQKLDAMLGLVNYIKNHMNDGAYYAGQQVTGALCMLLNALPQYTNAILASINKLDGDVVEALADLGEKVDFNNSQNGQMLSQLALSNKIAADNRALITQLLNLTRNNGNINQTQLNTVIRYLANLANQGQSISCQLRSIINMLPGLAESVTTAIDASTGQIINVIDSSTGQVVAAIDQNTQAANANARAIIAAMPDNEQVVYMLNCVKAAIEALEMQVTVNVENNNTNVNENYVENNIDLDVFVELLAQIMPSNPDLTPILNAINQLHNDIQQGNQTASQIHNTELDILHLLQQKLPAIYQKFDEVITAINNIDTCNCTPQELQDYTAQLQLIINLIQQLVNQGVTNNENIQDMDLEDLLGGWGGDLKSAKKFLNANASADAKIKALGKLMEKNSKKIFSNRPVRSSSSSMTALNSKKALEKTPGSFSPKGYYEGLTRLGLAKKVVNKATGETKYEIDQKKITGFVIGRLQADKSSMAKVQKLIPIAAAKAGKHVDVPEDAPIPFKKPSGEMKVNGTPMKVKSANGKFLSADLSSKAYSAIAQYASGNYIPDEYVEAYAQAAYDGTLVG